MEQTRDRTQRTWWLPRAVVRLLDAAEHAETQWVQAARTRQASAAVTEPPSHRWQARAAEGRQTTSPDCVTAPPRPYNEELKGHLYSVLSRKTGTSRKVAGWACAVCRTAPATARKTCGVLHVSWTGSHNAPRSCLLTVTVDFCPSGEHRALAQVPYREAAERFRTWLAETAPAVAAAAGPDRLDGLPAHFRPVIADTSGKDLELF
ncbi:hypothetical protein ACFZBE_40800 [Streptomyces sp. NPDC008061]|uniref:hypothetical protein n=1 Tax=Streptomyces sp. NPDC008061 TaxID=3364805 RepID=UPI0036E7E237